MTSLSQRAATNALFDAKYNLSKKLYANIRKFCDDTFYLKQQTLNFIQHLLRFQQQSSVKSHKCQTKCLFALVHLSVEHHKFFDSLSVLRLVNSIRAKKDKNLLAAFQPELFRQWLELNYDPNDGLINAATQFPFHLFEPSHKEPQAQNLKASIPQLLTFYCLKTLDNQHPLDKSQLTALFDTWLRHSPQLSMLSHEFESVLGTDLKFGIEFCSGFLLELFLNPQIGQQSRVKAMKETGLTRLITPALLKKHFHSIFIQVFTQTKSFGTGLVDRDQLETLVVSFGHMVLNILGQVTQKVDWSPAKLFLQLIQNCWEDPNQLAPKHQAEAALYKLIYKSMQNLFGLTDCSQEFSYSLELNRILLKSFLLTAGDSGSLGLLSAICTRSNYQICLHHFVLFKMSDLVKVCCGKLRAESQCQSFKATNAFFEVRKNS